MQFNWWLLVHHHLIAYFASMLSMWRIYVTNTFSVTIVHISLYIRTAHSNIFSPKKIHTSCWTSEFAQCSAPLVHNSWLCRCTQVPREHQNKPRKPSSTAVTFYIREIPSWSLRRRSAGGGINHGGLLHQHHSPSDELWVVYHRPSGP